LLLLFFVFAKIKTNAVPKSSVLTEWQRELLAILSKRFCHAFSAVH